MGERAIAALELPDGRLPDARPGGLLSGRYRWERAIGRGGMAHVHLARRVDVSFGAASPSFSRFERRGSDEPRCARTNEPRSRNAYGIENRVAIKRILPEFAKNPNHLRMFCREAAITLHLSHPNIVRGIDFGEQDGELMLVMEYIEGVSCKQLMDATARQNRLIPEPVVRFVVCEVLRALEHAHDAGRSACAQGIIHRDVSPGNVLIARDGAVKLCDFGVARWNDGRADLLPGALKGKLRYMAPEQLLGLDASPRSDLFALGVVLHEMFAGCVPRRLRTIFRRALALDPRDRYADAREFRLALADAGDTSEARPTEPIVSRWLNTLGLWPQEACGPILWQQCTAASSSAQRPANTRQS